MRVVWASWGFLIPRQPGYNGGTIARLDFWAVWSRPHLRRYGFLASQYGLAYRRVRAIGVPLVVFHHDPPPGRWVHTLRAAGISVWMQASSPELAARQSNSA